MAFGFLPFFFVDKAADWLEVGASAATRSVAKGFVNSVSTVDEDYCLVGNFAHFASYRDALSIHKPAAIHKIFSSTERISRPLPCQQRSIDTSLSVRFREPPSFLHAYSFLAGSHPPSLDYRTSDHCRLEE
jgi:hypothetical protein